jgi:NSS family neurotransmitter:Na+ symporter
MIATSAKVAISDTIVSLLAGIAIFPVVFEFGLEPSHGPGLLFNTIPLVFAKVPMGNVLLVLFFLLTAIAATTAMLSLVEVPVAFLTEEKGLNRKLAVIVTSSIMLVVGALTVHPQSLFGTVKIFGKSFFDFFDYLSSNILLPLGGLLIAIFVGYFINRNDIDRELSNEGKLSNKGILKIYHVTIRYIAPILLLIVFLVSIGVI